MSNEYKSFLHKIKVKKLKIYLTQIIILILFFVIWQLLTDLNVIDSFIISSPKNIIKTIYNLYNNNNLFIHIYTTIYEIIISFIISLLVSLFVATILWYSDFLAKILDPFLTILNSLPKVALGPIILVWFGATTKSIILMGIMISVIILTINIYNGFINVDENKIKLIKSFTDSKIKLYRYLILPKNIELIISNLKIGISMSFIGVIMGEFLVSKKGIGYLILYGSQVFNLDLVMSGILLLIITVIILYYLIVLIEKIYKKTTPKV